MKLKLLVAAMAIGLGAAASAPVIAQGTGPVKIGFITDMSGLYADIDGPAGAEVIRWAVQDFGGKVLGRPVEVLVADHQNKADVASSKAREWVDKDGLAMLIGGTSSGTGIAMSKVMAEKKRPFIAIGAGSARLTNEDCTPYTIHYAYDTVDGCSAALGQHQREVVAQLAQVTVRRQQGGTQPESVDGAQAISLALVDQPAGVVKDP